MFVCVVLFNCHFVCCLRCFGLCLSLILVDYSGVVVGFCLFCLLRLFV